MEEVRSAFVAEIEKWAFPMSDWEVRVVQEIKQMPVVTVERYPDDALAYMRMPPRQCHKNASFMEENDPECRIKQVTGWWPQEGQYVLHSVIVRDDQYICVTPAPLHSTRRFDFIPDAKIKWRDEGEVRVPYRDGVKIGPGVRDDPEKTIVELGLMREKLLSAKNPYEVMIRR